VAVGAAVAKAVELVADRAKETHEHLE
jgi:hypothetical protein